MTSLATCNAVVTGAGSGIGRAIALALAKEGAAVSLLGRTVEKLRRVAEEGWGLSGSLSPYRVDLQNDDEIAALAAMLREELRGVDLLVHSAGEIFIGTVEKAPVADFDRLYRVNLRAPYLLTQALLPALKMRRGEVVFINSSAGLSARGEVSQYAATKHALKAVADSLRQEVNGDGVRVVSVYPGRTATPMQEALCAMEGKEYDPARFMQPEDVAAAVLNAVTLPRSAEITDLSIRPMRKT